MIPSIDDVRRSARSLAKQPVFTLVVVLSLALSIAFNTTMYSVFDALGHPQLDMRDPDALYWVQYYGDYKGRTSMVARDAAVMSGMHSYEAIARAERVVTSGLFERGQNLYEGALASVSDNYFDVVRPRVLAGRLFVPADLESGAEPIVLDEPTAAALFPNGVSPVGQTIDINRKPHTVIGVVSRHSKFPQERTSAWTVVPASTRGIYRRLIRIRPGYTAADADRELRVVADGLATAAGEQPRDVAFRFFKAANADFQVRRFDYALIFAVAAVLLVACANLANLQLARGLARRRDLALRAALGATRARVIAHLLTESGLLAFGGLIGGALLSYLSARLLVAAIPAGVAGGAAELQLHMSWRIAAFALAAAVACLVLTGLLPALVVSRADPNELLKAGAGTGATKRNRSRYGVLVAAEIALALALTSGAAVLVRTALRVSDGIGYDLAPLVTGRIVHRMGDTTATLAAELQLVAARVRVMHGVADASAERWVQMQGNAVMVGDASGAREFPVTGFSALAVTPSYFRTRHVPIIAGRDFIDGERDASVAIIDEQTAHVLWPNADPIGALFKFGDAKSDLPYVRVVGVMGEADGFEMNPELRAQLRRVRALGQLVYLPGPAERASSRGQAFAATFTVRAAADPARLPVTLRRALLESSDVTASAIMSESDARGLGVQRATARFTASLFGLFALLGVGLAAFGVYGVVAHSVTERRREFGVRIALGATARDILHAALRESVVVALAGVALGLLCTKYGVMLLQGQVATDDLYDVALFAAVALVLGLTAAAAALVPAMRATRIDPTESLRND